MPKGTATANVFAGVSVLCWYVFACRDRTLTNCLADVSGCIATVCGVLLASVFAFKDRTTANFLAGVSVFSCGNSGIGNLGIGNEIPEFPIPGNSGIGNGDWGLGIGVRDFGPSASAHVKPLCSPESQIPITVVILSENRIPEVPNSQFPNSRIPNSRELGNRDFGNWE